jgi:hypothetical protein
MMMSSRRGVLEQTPLSISNGGGRAMIPYYHGFVPVCQSACSPMGELMFNGEMQL